MTEEMKQWLKGSYEGEVLQEYIEKLESEITALNKALEKTERNYKLVCKLYDGVLSDYERLKEVKEDD